MVVEKNADEPSTSENQSAGTRRGFLRDTSLILAGAVPQAAVAATPKSSRIGLIGDDRTAFRQVEALLNDSPAAKLAAIAAPYPDLLQRTFRTLKGILPDRVCVDPKHRYHGRSASSSLIANADIDHLVIGGIPSFRSALAVDALRRGIRTTVITPLATELQQVVALQEVLPEHRERLQISEGPSSPTLLQRRLAAISDGALGTIRAISADCYVPASPKYRTQKKWSQHEAAIRNWQSHAELSGGKDLQAMLPVIHILLRVCESDPPASFGDFSTLTQTSQSHSSQVRVLSVRAEAHEQTVAYRVDLGGIDDTRLTLHSNSMSRKRSSVTVTGTLGTADLLHPNRCPLDDYTITNSRAGIMLWESPSLWLSAHHLAIQLRELTPVARESVR
jgi:hypothetical protein